MCTAHRIHALAILAISQCHQTVIRMLVTHAPSQNHAMTLVATHATSQNHATILVTIHATSQHHLASTLAAIHAINQHHLAHQATVATHLQKTLFAKTGVTPTWAVETAAGTAVAP